MQILIKTLTGTITLEVEMTDTILSMKKQIAEKENLSIQEQRLIFCGREMDDKRTVNDYKLHMEGPVHLVLRLNVAEAKIVARAGLLPDVNFFRCLNRDLTYRIAQIVHPRLPSPAAFFAYRERCVNVLRLRNPVVQVQPQLLRLEGEAPANRDNVWQKSVDALFNAILFVVGLAKLDTKLAHTYLGTILQAIRKGAYTSDWNTNESLQTIDRVVFNEIAGYIENNRVLLEFASFGITPDDIKAIETELNTNPFRRFPLASQEVTNEESKKCVLQ